MENGKPKCRPEFNHWPRALRICLSPFARESDRRAAAEEAGELDWATLADFLEREKLLAFTGWELERLGCVHLPPEIGRRWRRRYRAARDRAKHTLGVLARLLEVTEKAGVPTMILRTPYVVELVYGGNYGLRPFADIDVAVRPSDAERFVECLGSLGSADGYGRRMHASALMQAQLGSRLEFHFDGVNIDLHWDLALLYNFNRWASRARRQRGVWERAREMVLPWGRCFVLSDEDLVLHLAEHLVVQHDLRENTLRSLLDFAGMIRRGGHADALVELSVERGAPSALLVACYAASEIFETAPDGAVLDTLASRASTTARRYARRQLRHVTGGVSYGRRPASVVDEVRRTARALTPMAAFMDGWDSRLALLRQIALPSRSLLSYTAERAVDRREYLGYCCVHPFLLPLAAPALATLALRQLEEWKDASTRIMKRALYGTVGQLFAARYYLANLRNTGLAGPGALGNWRQRISPRVPGTHAGCSLWLHIAGPGDARAGIIFLRELRRLAPTQPIHITCTTIPARAYIADRLEGLEPVSVGWLPFDSPPVVKRFVRRLRPLAFIGLQGEFWPNLLRELRRRGVPSIALRVDTFDWTEQREFPQWLLGLYRQMLLYLSVASARGPIFAERLIGLGVPPSRVAIGGDYRLAALPEPDESRRADYVEMFGLGPDRPLVVFAGPRLDELGPLLAALDSRIRSGSWRVLVAPAELDAVSRMQELIAGSGLEVRLRRALAGGGNDGIVLLDTHGELFDIYPAASIAIMGDSFGTCRSEGRNFWEALVQGVPVLYGRGVPSTDPVRRLELEGVARRVRDFDEVEGAVTALFERRLSRQHVREVALAAMADVPPAAATDVDLVLALLAEREAATSLHLSGDPWRAVDAARVITQANFRTGGVSVSPS